MKLMADDKGRLGCRELFPPLKTFDATRQPDGSIRVIEVTEPTQPARLVRRDGRTFLESEHTITNADTEAVMNQFP